VQWPCSPAASISSTRHPWWSGRCSRVGQLRVGCKLGTGMRGGPTPYPELPTLADGGGAAGLARSRLCWYHGLLGLVAPTATPKPVVDHITGRIVCAILADASVRHTFNQSRQLRVGGHTPDESRPSPQGSRALGPRSSTHQPSNTMNTMKLNDIPISPAPCRGTPVRRSPYEQRITGSRTERADQHKGWCFPRPRG